METWELQDLLMNIESAAEAHEAVARSCYAFNDLDGHLYHTGMAYAYHEVAEFLKERLSELDSESGR